MDFPNYDFASLNEADIREEIIAPLLRHLGYRSGTNHNIIREQALSYSKSSLGRKKTTDPIVRGRADYICEADQQVRWVIEAKSPNEPLDHDAEDQSWMYANHFEIRAVYFCLANGREFKIFQTTRGPAAEAIFQCNYEQLAASLVTIENILSPSSILRDHPLREIDRGIPIGPGLRSIVRVTNGTIVFENNTRNLTPMIGLVMSITGGSVERNESGSLEAYIETQVPYQSLQRLNEKLALHSMRLFSTSKAISVDPKDPTVFTATTNHVLPQGEMALDLTTWREVPFPQNIHVQTESLATAYLVGGEFQGTFNAVLSYQEYHARIGMNGLFSVHLA